MKMNPLTDTSNGPARKFPAFIALPSGGAPTCVTA
jgi:hypothetical protein